MFAQRFFVILLLVVVAAAAAQRLPAPSGGSPGADEIAWVCPMHPDYTMDVEGKCPRRRKVFAS